MSDVVPILDAPRRQLEEQVPHLAGGFERLQRLEKDAPQLFTISSGKSSTQHSALDDGGHPTGSNS
jgi:hypothetical protein